MAKHIIGFGIFAIIVVGWISMFPNKSLMSDDEMVKEFNRYRATYEKLVSLAAEDNTIRAVYPDHILLNESSTINETSGSLTPGPSQNRLNEYRSLLAEAGLRLISKDDGLITFGSLSADITEIDRYEHLVISKGIVYSETALPVVDSLDSTIASYVIYKSLGNNWYLYKDIGISKPE